MKSYWCNFSTFLDKASVKTQKLLKNTEASALIKA